MDLAKNLAYKFNIYIIMTMSIFKAYFCSFATFSACHFQDQVDFSFS